MSFLPLQPLSSSISSPSLGLDSSRKYTCSSNLCQKQQKHFNRATTNTSQEAVHSKLNKTKLKDHVINFQHRGAQNNLKNISQRIMTQSKVSISPRLKSNESLQNFTLRSKSSIKRFARTEKSRSAPKFSLVSRQQQKKQQKLMNPQGGLLIVYNKPNELVNSNTNDFKLYEGIIKKLREEKSVLYQKNSQLTIERMKFLDQIKYQNQQIKSLTLKLMIKTESSHIEKSNRLINAELSGKQEEENHQSIKVKKELIAKTEKIDLLNGSIIKLEGKIRQLTEQLKVENLKSISEKKKMALQREQALSTKELEIRSLKTRIPSLEMKLKAAIKEVEEKDRFIKNYLMGKTSDKVTKEYICEVMEKFKETFIDEMRFAEKISELEQKIRQSE